MADRNTLIIALVLVIVVLVGIIVYAFVIKPAYIGYVTQKQTEGVQIAVNAILAQIQQNGFVQIPIGNQTLFLYPDLRSPSQLAQQPTAEQ